MTGDAAADPQKKEADNGWFFVKADIKEDCKDTLKCH